MDTQQFLKSGDANRWYLVYYKGDEYKRVYSDYAEVVVSQIPHTYSYDEWHICRFDGYGCYSLPESLYEFCCAADGGQWDKMGGYYDNVLDWLGTNLTEDEIWKEVQEYEQER